MTMETIEQKTPSLVKHEGKRVTAVSKRDRTERRGEEQLRNGRSDMEPNWSEATEVDLVCAHFFTRMMELMPRAFSEDPCPVARALYFAFKTRRDQLMARSHPDFRCYRFTPPY